jgi:hypothetical protein
VKFDDSSVDTLSKVIYADGWFASTSSGDGFLIANWTGGDFRSAAGVFKNNSGSGLVLNDSSVTVVLGASVELADNGAYGVSASSAITVSSMATPINNTTGSYHANVVPIASVAANKTAPSAPIAGTLGWLWQADGVACNHQQDAFGSLCQMTFRRANGTATSPSALSAAQNIVQIGVRGYGATGYSTTKAAVSIQTAEDWTDTAQGTQIALGTTAVGTTTLNTALLVEGIGARVAAGTPVPAGGLTGAGLRFGPVTQSLGIYFGSGVPTLSAGKGSLYLRTDGGATNNRLYVNTDGASGWTSLTSGA